MYHTLVRISILKGSGIRAIPAAAKGLIGTAVLAVLALALLYGGVWKWILCRVYVPPGGMLVLSAKFGDENPNPDELRVVPDGVRGIRERVLGEGRHFYNPFTYDRIAEHKVIEIPPGFIGLVESKSGKPLPPGEFLYSLEVKRDWENQVEYLVPPPVPERLLADLERLALGCYQALGCRDVSRVDLRLKGGVPHFIEVNPLPGLSPTYGDLPILAARMGWTHRELVLAIVRHALERGA